MDNLKKCSIFGYLPKEDESHPLCITIKEEMKKQVIDLMSKGYYHFISAVELGTELWLAEIMVELQEKFLDLTFTPYICDEHRADNWDETLRARYFDHILPKVEPAKTVINYPPSEIKV